jgi:hypothetical protein
MPAKNTRRARRSQDLLTLKEAFGHRELIKFWADDHTAWCKRRDARLLQFKSRPDAAVNLQVYRDAVAIEFETEDPEPSPQSILATKIYNRSLPFYEQDAIANVVRGDPADLAETLAATQEEITCRKRRAVLIEANDLRKACRAPKSLGRKPPGRPPEERDRVAAAIKRDLEAGVFTPEQVRDWPQEALAEQYGCKNRESAKKARELVLSEKELPTITDTK